MKVISNIFSREIEPVSREFPSLNSKFDNGVWQIQGVLPIVDGNGFKHDEYEVRIMIPSNFPKIMPLLFEIGGKIRHTPEFHINPDGSCCLTVPAKEVLILRNGLTVLDFIKKHAIPFLANHTYKQRFGEYAAGEYSHGLDGIIEFYFEVFNSNNLKIVIDGLEASIFSKIPERNSLCFCGSGTKYKKCHMKSLDTLALVSNDVLIKDLKRILEARKSEMQKDENLNTHPEYTSPGNP